MALQASISFAEPSLSKADTLLLRTRQQLPRVPLHIEAELKSKKRSGSLKKRMYLDMSINWGGKPPTAIYRIQDGFGTPIEQMEITWETNNQPTYVYYKGGDLELETLPDLYGPVADTDFSWIDLSFSFLWWKGGEIVRTEKVKGRRCVVIDVLAPTKGAIYHSTRLWIDPEVYAVLQVDAYDKDGTAIRRVKVKSFKKINDIWTIKDLDIYRFPSKHKTTLRVKNIESWQEVR
ncbi:MAG: outer membrane lipoprotein-sorting protein [Kiritimatiellae bacterium]|nr:outer membrane lipoprotein-sorting protein [Kiritimatiellia bacterium]